MQTTTIKCASKEKLELLDLIMTRIIQIERTDKDKDTKFLDGYIVESTSPDGDLVCWRPLDPSSFPTNKLKTPIIDTVLALQKPDGKNVWLNGRGSNARTNGRPIYSSDESKWPVNQYSKQTNEKMAQMLRKIYKDLEEFIENDPQGGRMGNKSTNRRRSSSASSLDQAIDTISKKLQVLKDFEKQQKARGQRDRSQPSKTKQLEKGKTRRSSSSSSSDDYQSKRRGASNKERSVASSIEDGLHRINEDRDKRRSKTPADNKRNSHLIREFEKVKSKSDYETDEDSSLQESIEKALRDVENKINEDEIKYLSDSGRPSNRSTKPRSGRREESNAPGQRKRVGLNDQKPEREAAGNQDEIPGKRRFGILKKKNKTNSEKRGIKDRLKFRRKKKAVGNNIPSSNQNEVGSKNWQPKIKPLSKGMEAFIGRTNDTMTNKKYRDQQPLKGPSYQSEQEPPKKVTSRTSKYINQVNHRVKSIRA